MLILTNRATLTRSSIITRVAYCVVACSLLLLTPIAYGQSFNFTFGGGPGFPLGTTKDFVSNSYNLVVGGGPNLHSRFKLDAEFMFHGIPVKQAIAKQFEVSDIKGRLYSLSGNVLVGTSIRRSSGAYLIGGGGWFRRTLEAKQTVLRQGTVCVPFWEWWNVQCVDGIFPTDVTVASRTVSAPGFNVGGGLTFAIGESPANFYIEMRYHRAFTHTIDTVVLPLTFGIRF